MSAKPKTDINAFLAALGQPQMATPDAPTPIASTPGLPADPAGPPQPAKQRNGLKQRAKEIEKPPTAMEAEGFDTHGRTQLTWVKKRIFLNEPGIENAIDQIKALPPAETSLHAIMGGDYNGFDLIPAIQRLSGHPLEGLHIATLGFNQKNNLQLCMMMDTGLIQGPVTVIASLYFANSDPAVWAKAKQELEQRGSTLTSSRNHAKIIACRTGPPDNPAWIVNEGSANLRSCNALEQFALFNSEPLYLFHTGWIRDIANRHAGQ